MDSSHRSFSSRRPAAEALPPFHMPPRHSSDIPSMAPYPIDQDPRGYPSTITPPDSSEASGAGDGVTPGLSGMPSAGSQGSQALPHAAHHHHHYGFGGHNHGSWPTPGTGTTYGPGPSSSQARQQPPQPQPLHSHGATAQYEHFTHNHAGAPYLGQRSSQSPATGGAVLTAAPYDHQQHLQHFPAHLTQAAAAAHSASPPPPASAPNGAPAVEAFSHTRPHSGGGFPIPAPAGQFPLPSPTNTLSHRTLGALGGAAYGSQGHSSVATPTTPYRPTFSYQSVPGMSAGLMSGMPPAGGQMGLVPSNAGMANHINSAYIYAQPTASSQMDRPFKCDQCVQSFSRNHDLKRHKRIHLAVKPFPCTYCSKQFSRKDALKRHRLVKGCEEKAKAEQGRAHSHGRNSNSDVGDDSNSPINGL